jgi:hypothetical protein
MKATASHMTSIAAKQLICRNWNEGFLYREPLLIDNFRSERVHLQIAGCAGSSIPSMSPSSGRFIALRRRFDTVFCPLPVKQAH